MALQKPSAEDVRSIISTDLTDAQIESIINDAALIAEDCISSLDGDRQEAIIKWLTAHLIVSTNMPGSGVLTSWRMGNASESYARATTAEGLRSTNYGQQAVALDPNGCLIQIGAKTPKMVVL